MRFEVGDFYQTLEALLDQYHEVSEGQEGYRLPNGDDVPVFLQMQRTKGAEIKVTVMSVKDILSMANPKPDPSMFKPTIPIVEAVLQQGLCS